MQDNEQDKHLAPDVPEQPIVPNEAEIPLPVAAEPVVTTPAPTVATAPTAQQQPVAATPHNSPGILVLQWLTYAFWGWTVLALAWLTSISVSHFVDSSSGSGYFDSMIAYSLAAVIVLFIISLICDIFYSKHEPERKAGAAMVIMIIHTVIFALFGIGSLIIAVFAIVRMLIGDSAYSSDDSGPLSTLISFLIIAVVYGATLLRTLNPGWFKHAARVYWIFMTIVVIGIISLGIVGPAAQARLTRDDRMIVAGLPEVSIAISDYAQEKSALPTSLSEIENDLEGDALTIVQRDLVEYKPLGKSTPIIEEDDNTNGGVEIQSYRLDTFNYDLCVTYKEESDYYGGSYAARESSDYRDTSPDTYSHKKGKVCYELATGY